MKVVRFVTAGRIKYGIQGRQSIQAIEGEPFRDLILTEDYYRFSDVRLLSPCLPSKIVAMGLNYRSHAREIGARLPDAPLFFLKPPTAAIGPEENIIYPPSSGRVDYEGELAVVVGEVASRVRREDVPDHILGYTCFNDVTARDIQEQDRQWTRSKSFDTFAAIGPCIETELDSESVPVETYLNGELKQQGNTRDLIFGVIEMVSFVSGVMTLLPGDIIATGTPGGIGPMLPGDTVEVKIEPIGTLRNFVVKGSG